MFQTKSLLLSCQAERPLVGTEYQPEVQRLPAAGPNPELPPQIYSPQKSPMCWKRKAIFHGPAALWSPQLTGSLSETKWFVHVGERLGLV